MRILMITDDIAIDRRILLQANSLLKQGEEVILLAREDPYGDFDKFPTSEVIMGLKVLRVPAVATLHPLQKRAPEYQQMFVNILNRWSVESQDALNTYGVRYNEKSGQLAQFGKTSESKARQFKKKMRIKAFLARQSAQRLMAVGSYKTSLLASKLGAKLNRNPMLGEYFLEHALRLRPDVVHVHDLPQLPVGVALKEKLNVPLIYDMHELYPLIDTLTKKEQKLLRRIEKRDLKKVNHATIVNPFAAEMVTKMYPGIKEPTVIQNATLPTKGFSPHIPHDDRIRKKLNLSADTKILLLQGWIHKSRGGIEELVESMKDVRSDIHLVLLGYGEMKEMKALGKEFGVDHRIHIIDAVPWDELLWWSASADVGIIPYIPTGFHTEFASPNKLYEFIAAALPIVANDLPFIRSVVVPNEFGSVNRFSDDPSTFSDVINRVFETENLNKYKKNLLANGYKYLWHEEEKVLFDVYTKIGRPVNLSPAKDLEPVYSL